MALNLANINYSGKEIAGMIIRDTYDSSLLFNAGVRIIPSLKGKYVWHDISANIVINDGSPDCPTFNSEFTLTQNNGLLCDYHIAGTIAHDALIGTYREQKYKEGVLIERVSDDAELQGSMMLMIFESLNEQQNTKWLNDSYVYQCQNGLLEQFETDLYTALNPIQRPVPAGQKLTAIAITPANVQDELQRLVETLPGKYAFGQQSSQFSKPKFFVSYAIAKAYQRSLTYTAAPAGAGFGMPSIDNLPAFAGFDFVVLAGLGDDVMFLTPPDNLGLVFDTDKDLTNLVIADGLQDSTLCKLYKFRLDYRTSIIFGEGEAVVYYR